MAKHSRRRSTLARWTGRGAEWDDLEVPDALPAPTTEEPQAQDVAQAEEAQEAEDELDGDQGWFEPAEHDGDGYAARMDVSLASMLMLGTTAYQRIDGIGMARKALEAPPTGDPRRDLSEAERLLLVNARAWCLLVHGDLGHRSRLDDPFVLAEAERCVEEVRRLAPDSTQGATSLALLRIRQRRTEEALQSAQRAVETFARMPDHQRNGSTQGGALLAVLTLALAAAASGDANTARTLAEAARAARIPLDLDDPAFAALLAQIEGAVAGHA